MGKPYEAPDPAPLPKVRLRDAAPFTVTGIDFMGLCTYKVERKKERFMCAYSRAPQPVRYTSKSSQT